MTPIAGKVGRLQTVISATTVNHEFEDCTIDLAADMIETNGYEKTPDGDDNYWNSYIAGLCNGEVKYGGIFNSAKNPVDSFKPGKSNYTSLFCGVTHTIGFTCTGKNRSISTNVPIKGAAKFSGVFQVEGVTTYPAF